MPATVLAPIVVAGRLILLLQGVVPLVLERDAVGRSRHFSRSSRPPGTPPPRRPRAAAVLALPRPEHELADEHLEVFRRLSIRCAMFQCMSSASAASDASAAPSLSGPTVRRRYVSASRHALRFVGSVAALSPP